MRSIVKLSKVVCCALLAGSLACLSGCGKGSPAPFKPDPAVANFPKMGKAVGNAPESKIKNMKTSQEKVAYLQDLGADSNFNPKMHKDMLEKYSKDTDADIAAAAKALLDKAQ
jgi:hypothetical protein